MAAWKLVDEGYQVIGATHHILDHSHCFHEDTLERAKRVCRKLGIPYYLVDLRKAFRTFVIDNFIHTYLAGETPNPCVRCNRHIRFNLFYREMRKLLTRDGILDPDEQLYIATGHYARKGTWKGKSFLRKGADPKKEQSYMLYRIPRDVLPFVHFPLGEMTKPEVVSLAERENLPSKSIKESQDICFIDGAYTGFLRRELGAGQVDRMGEIRDLEGNVLGRHRGYLHYTIGQRQGLGLSDGPWYVAAIDGDTNLVTVGRAGSFERDSFFVDYPLWDLPELPSGASSKRSSGEWQVKIRYNSREIPGMVEFITAPPDPMEKPGSWENPGPNQEPDLRQGSQLKVRLKEPAVLTPGQSAVFYREDWLIGGGLISTKSDITPLPGM